MYDKPDIIEVINPVVHLRRAGRNLVGNCPFHQEKTPSFMVNPERQTFHCFGCHEKGDVIDFVRKYHNVDFNRALGLLGIRSDLSRQEKKKIIEERRRRQAEKERRAAEWKAYSSMLSFCLRTANRILVMHDYQYEGDEAIEYLPELLSLTGDMDKAGELYDIVLFANRARAVLEGGKG